MATKGWYFRDAEGLEYGPFTDVELRGLVRAGRVGRDTLVRADAGAVLIAASDIDGLIPASQAGEGDPPEGVLLEEVDVRGGPGHTHSRGPVRHNALAIVSAVSGVLGWTILPLFGAASAIITGHLALGQIERGRGRERGKVAAAIGLLLGYIEAALLALVATSLHFMGLSVAGLLAFLSPQVDGEGRRDRHPPRVERPLAVAPATTPAPDPGNPSRGDPDAPTGGESGGRPGEARGAVGREGPEGGIAALPRMAPATPPSNPIGSWDVTGPGLRRPFVIEFADGGEVTVRYIYGSSSISPWSYRAGRIEFGESIRVDEFRVNSPWNLYWRGPDEVDVIDPEGQELALKRRTP